MALELEEEKRAQAERERRLQEQAKKIENLSSMVFFANREESSDVYKKVLILCSLLYNLLFFKTMSILTRGFLHPIYFTVSCLS